MPSAEGSRQLILCLVRCMNRAGNSRLIYRIALSHSIASYLAMAILLAYLQFSDQPGFTLELDGNTILFSLLAPLLLPFIVLWGFALWFETRFFQPALFLYCTAIYAAAWTSVFLIVSRYSVRERNI